MPTLLMSKLWWAGSPLLTMITTYFTLYLQACCLDCPSLSLQLLKVIPVTAFKKSVTSPYARACTKLISFNCMGRNFKDVLLNEFPCHADGVPKQGLQSRKEHMGYFLLHSSFASYFSNVRSTREVLCADQEICTSLWKYFVL